MTDANGIRVWIDGSFINSKEEPNNIDGCWQYDADVDVDKLDSVFMDIYAPIAAVKAKYRVDFLISGLLISDSPGIPSRNFSKLIVMRAVREFWHMNENRGVIMILNQRQLKITQAQIRRLAKTLALSKEKKRAMDEKIYKPMIAGIESQIGELKSQVQEYEKIRKAKALSYNLDNLHNLLIQARVAKGLTQKQLADRLKIDARQIQRYEKTNYSSVSLERVIDICKALGISIKGRIALKS